MFIMVVYFVSLKYHIDMRDTVLPQIELNFAQLLLKWRVDNIFW